MRRPDRTRTIALCVAAVAMSAGSAQAVESQHLLPDDVRERVRQDLTNLQDRVTLVVFTQEFECRTCAENTQLAREVAELSDKVEVKVYDFKRDQHMVDKYGVDKIPATIVEGERDYGVRFYGVPGGYEFGALLDAVKQVSKGESGLSEVSKIMLKQIDKPVHVQVFVTPT